MHYFLKSLLALALSPALGHAAYSLENINAHCSDALTISQGEGVSFQCLGNFSLTGDGDAARLWSDRSITLSATGDLRLNHLSIVAPQIQLLASHVSIDQNAALISRGGSVLIDARGRGSVALQQGSTIDVSAGAITMAAHSNRTPWGSAGQVSLPSRSGALMLSNASGIHLQSSFPRIVGSTLSVASSASTLTWQVASVGAIPEPATWLLTLIGGRPAAAPPLELNTPKALTWADNRACNPAALTPAAT